jgi:hypothetical protein
MYLTKFTAHKQKKLKSLKAPTIPTIRHFSNSRINMPITKHFTIIYLSNMIRKWTPLTDPNMCRLIN